MRLGAPIFEAYAGPEEWARAVRAQGYGAAYCPVDAKADDATVRAFERAAGEANVVIAEVGAWSNPLGPNDAERKKALAYCQEQLALADRIGARCCVNIAGSRGEPWDGPDPANLTEETFELTVEMVRAIIDAVKPTRTFYTLETMPWMYPDSVDSYVRLMKAIDRPQFAVHLDPINLVCSPQRYFGNAALLRECFAKLGPWIKSCHGKDIALETRMTTHLNEVVPGQGGMNYAVYLQELSRLDDVPLMLEHLQRAEEYTQAAAYVRSVAEKEGLRFD